MMFRNEGFYAKEDTKGMLKESEIRGDEMQGDYFAICDNGRMYHAKYVNEYFPGGVFFFTIPQGVEILGYIPA